MPLPPLTGDLAKDLSPLTGDIKKDLGEAPAPPAPPGPLMSSPKGFFGPGLLANLESRVTGKTPEQAYAQRVPQLEQAAGVLAPIVAPGAGSALARIGIQGGVGAGLGAMTGAKEGPLGAASGAMTGGLAGAAGAGVGEGVGKGIGAIAGPLASRQSFKATTNKVAQQLDDYLSSEVPAWKGLGGKGPRALWEKAHGGGEQKLDAMFKAFKAEIPEALETTVPRDLAFKAGFEIPEDVAEGAAKHGVQVNLRELVGRLGDLKGRVKHEAWGAINQGLTGVPISPALQSARKQYAFGMGWIDFASKGKFLTDATEGGFDLLKAQKALTEHGRQRLLRRGMNEPFRTIQGQGAVTAKERNLPLPFKVGPLPMNIPLGTMYKGVPQGPLSGVLQGGGGRFGGVLAGLGTAAAQQPEEE
jgi:hypothetical protein